MKYSIGKVAKLCHVSVKTLRYYDEIDLLKPAFVNEDNGYRYYTNHEIHKVALIKYYKELGFKLEQIKELIKHYELNTLEHYFDVELKRIEKEVEEAQRKYFAIQEWQKLVQQGRALSQLEKQFDVKRMNSYKMVVYTYDYNGHDLVMDNGFVYSNAFVQFCQLHQYYTYGPFMLHHPNTKGRMSGDSKMVECMSEVYDVDKCDPDHIVQVGDVLALTYMHKGDYAALPSIYEEMLRYAKKHDLRLRGDSYERYIIDSWSTLSADEYLTEITMPLREEE